MLPVKENYTYMSKHDNCGKEHHSSSPTYCSNLVWTSTKIDINQMPIQNLWYANVWVTHQKLIGKKTNCRIDLHKSKQYQVLSMHSGGIVQSKPMSYFQGWWSSVLKMPIKKSYASPMEVVPHSLSSRKEIVWCWTFGKLYNI
jgi:hypothetical protein